MAVKRVQNALVTVGKLLLFLPLLPVLIVVIPILNLLGLNKMNAGPDYVADYLEKFIAGTEGDWEWDDFCSIPLTNEQLDGIVRRACAFSPPRELGDDERNELRELLAEVKAL